MVSNQILAVMRLMNAIKSPTGTYWQAVGQASRTYTDSDENKAAIARGNAALLEIEKAARQWVIEHPEAAAGLDADAKILDEIAAERVRQDARFGEQNHPDGTGGAEARKIAETARATCDAATERGCLTWLHVSDEEHCEALAESDPVKLRAELVQDAAVKVAWIAAIDRRGERQL